MKYLWLTAITTHVVLCTQLEQEITIEKINKQSCTQFIVTDRQGRKAYIEGASTLSSYGYYGDQSWYYFDQSLEELRKQFCCNQEFYSFFDRLHEHQNQNNPSLRQQVTGYLNLLWPTQK